VVQTLLVINPNASSAVTQAIDDAMAPLGHAGTAIEVVGLADGPPGIETQQDVERVVPLIIRTIRERNDAHG
jgi:Asp/Glu/hydantoin racemase